MINKTLRGTLTSLAGLAGLMVLAGCATPPPADDPDAVADFQQLNDPIEPTNREIFAFNDWLDDNALRPAAMAYRTVTPRFARDRIHDVLANAKSPAVFVNDLLQGNMTRSGVTLARFLLNTTFGVGGLMDVATPLGLPAHVADFGETLAVWGVGEGFYLVLPLLGPSNPRDAIGYGVDSYIDPLDIYLDDNHMRWVALTRFFVGGLSLREGYIEAIDDIKRTSLDYYSAMRSLYRQRREAQIKDAESGAWAPDSSRKQ